MDEKDKMIIDLLRSDSRRPFTEIAERIGVTEATVRNRVRSLEKRGIIKSYTVQLDHKKMGYRTKTLLGLDVEPENLIEAAGKLAEIREVKNVATCTGDHMIMAEVWAKDSSHLGKIMSEKVGEIKGVKNLCPAIVMEEIKV